MRLVICDYSGHPFQVELSRALALRGHDVLHLHFSDFPTPKGKLRLLPDDPPGFAVEGLSLKRGFDKQAFLRRRFWEAKVGALAAARALAFRADAVVGCNMPLDAQRKLQHACLASKTPFVFWLQDVYSRAICHYLRERFGFPGGAIGRYYQRLEGAMLRRSDAVVAISEKFRPPLEAWGVPRDRVRVMPNWAPLSEIYPVPKDNDWARTHGLERKLVALYTGTLGLKHDPALLLSLAQAGAAQGLEVVVISEGAAAEWLAAQKRARGVVNLTLLPFQPMERYPEVLGTGDILLAMVDEEASIFSVPSKILSYLAAGKPIVASIRCDNDAAATIVQAQAGRVVAPGNSAAFCQAVGALAADSTLRMELGRNARTFAESRFGIDGIAKSFEQVFAGALRSQTVAIAAPPVQVKPVRY
jgi:colanic acid biosynthesis glycosyl transferase WcaI